MRFARDVEEASKPDFDKNKLHTLSYKIVKDIEYRRKNADRHPLRHEQLHWITSFFISEIEKIVDESDKVKVFWVVELSAIERPTQSIKSEDVKVISKLIDLLDPDNKIRSKISAEFWRELQRVDPVNEKYYDVCSWCKKLYRLKKCSACETSYCNRECQLADWKTHKLICEKKSEELKSEREFRAKYPNHMPVARMDDRTATTCHYFMEDYSSQTY